MVDDFKFKDKIIDEDFFPIPLLQYDSHLAEVTMIILLLLQLLLVTVQPIDRGCIHSTCIASSVRVWAAIKLSTECSSTVK